MRILLVVGLMFSLVAFAEVKPLYVNDSADPNGAYALKIIKLALSHTNTNYQLIVNSDKYTQSKIIADVEAGTLDILWNSSNQEIEEKLRPVRIPIDKGLLSYRIFIIRKDMQSKFDDIKSLDDLKQVSIGQGRTWADTKILEANGLNVVKVNKYEGLFHMVDGGRFDAFSRGVHEPFGELAARPNFTDLTIEKNLMLVYRLPLYLFVARENVKLAHDLEQGLNAAIADCSFDEVFLNDPSVRNALENANMKNRRIIELVNPTLSIETPLYRKELWFDPLQKAGDCIKK